MGPESTHPRLNWVAGDYPAPTGRRGKHARVPFFTFVAGLGRNELSKPLIRAAMHDQ
jgi:hypothetical protein